MVTLIFFRLLKAISFCFGSHCSKNLIRPFQHLLLKWTPWRQFSVIVVQYKFYSTMQYVTKATQCRFGNTLNNDFSLICLRIYSKPAGIGFHHHQQQHYYYCYCYHWFQRLLFNSAKLRSGPYYKRFRPCVSMPAGKTWDESRGLALIVPHY